MTDKVIPTERWTAEEDALLWTLFNKRVPLRLIAEKLPHRSLGACDRRLLRLRRTGGVASNPTPWTAEQDKILLAALVEGKLSHKKIAETYFPDRTLSTVAHRIKRLTMRGSSPLKAQRPRTVDDAWRRQCQNGSQNLLRAMMDYYANRAKKMRAAA